VRRRFFLNDGSFPRWRATTSVAGSLAIVGEGSWGRKIRRFGGRIRCPRTRICDVRLARGRWRQRRVDRRRRHVGSFLRRPTGQVELGGTLRVLSSSLRPGRLGCDGAHCQTLLVAGPTMVVGPWWPFLLLLGCGAAPVRRLGGVALGRMDGDSEAGPQRRQFRRCCDYCDPRLGRLQWLCWFATANVCSGRGPCYGRKPSLDLF
jgi:hypothetical protein